MRLLSYKCIKCSAGLYLMLAMTSHIMHLQKEETTRLENENSKSNKFYVQVQDQGFVLYSAFLDNKSCTGNTNDSPLHSKNRQLTIIAWKNDTFTKQTFCCCILTLNRTIIKMTVVTLDQSNPSEFSAMRLMCFLSEDSENIIGVSLTLHSVPCSNNEQQYIKASIRNPCLLRNKIAMCNMLIYDTISPTLIIEWFEIHRFLGVDKFTIHQERGLNLEAQNVLKYYAKEGLVEIIDFDFLLKGTLKRARNKKALTKSENLKVRPQLWNDQRVALYDCRERHKYYEFAIDIDLDEILLTEAIELNAFKTHLIDIFRRNNIAVLSFYSNLHFTSGSPRNQTYPFLIRRYQEGTQPAEDRPKNMYMPSRIEAGEGSVHYLVPLEGFSREFLHPSKATIHQFRECKKDSTFSLLTFVNGTVEKIKMTCTSFRKTTSTAMKQLSSQDILIKNIRNVFRTFKLSNNKGH